MRHRRPVIVSAIGAVLTLLWDYPGLLIGVIMAALLWSL